MFVHLDVATEAAAPAAADELRYLVENYGLPFVRRHASRDALMAAVQAGGYVPNPEWARLLVPALLFVSGRHEDARTSMTQSVVHYGDDLTVPVVAQYHRFANGLTERLNA
jgi:hypothetical protein